MVRIVTDSSVLYTEEEAKEAGFDAVPLCIHIGDMGGRDLHQILPLASSSVYKTEESVTILTITNPEVLLIWFLKPLIVVCNIQVDLYNHKKFYNFHLQKKNMTVPL